MAKKKPAQKPAPHEHTIHLLATATGELLVGFAAVVTSQFPDVTFRVVTHPLQDSLEKLTHTLEALSGPNPIVVHALAEEAAKLLVRDTCVVQRVPHFDATGALVNFVADCVGMLPKNDVTRIHRIDSAYKRRIEAMEFALEHDDGLGSRSLQEADLVIVGVSRVSKSPTTLYLSSRGHKVANVSISPQTGFPKELDKVAKKKIVAFTMQPKRLQEIRAARAERMGTRGTAYEELSDIIRELMDAEAEYRKRGYPIIDVTNNTIEQNAVLISEVINLPIGGH